LEPSAWIVRHAALAPAGRRVLDLACGGGRHARLFLLRGHPVTALDIDLSGIADIAADPKLEMIEADLESGVGWPLGGHGFGAVVVTNYLWRPLLPAVVGAIEPGGTLFYETFAIGNELYGKPRNPDFLLRRGELLDAVRGRLDVVAYEDVVIARPRPAAVQRVVAVRPAATSSAPSDASTPS
jgi:SAM-dependent methyltransferase